MPIGLEIGIFRAKIYPKNTRDDLQTAFFVVPVERDSSFNADGTGQVLREFGHQTGRHSPGNEYASIGLDSFEILQSPLLISLIKLALRLSGSDLWLLVKN